MAVLITDPDAYPGEMSAFDNDDDDDDQYSDTSSTLTEISPSEFPTYFVERDSRLFPSHGDPSYPFPVDGHEHNRMNIQHDLLKELLNGNYVGPLRDILAWRPSQRQIRVLDLCTGTGKWVVEMAGEFPHVKFKGLDIAPIATRCPPQNVDFEVQDVTTRTRFPDSHFDFVHARHCSLLRDVDYNDMLIEASRVLRPGGLILLGEWIHLPVDPTTGTSPPGAVAFCGALDSSLRDSYKITNIAPYLTEFVSQLDAFDNIQSRDYYMPIGGTALGVKFRPTLEIWAESAKTVLARGGYNEDAIEGLADGFLDDIFSVAGLQIAYRVVTAHRVA